MHLYLYVRSCVYLVCSYVHKDISSLTLWTLFLSLIDIQKETSSPCIFRLLFIDLTGIFHTKDSDIITHPQHQYQTRQLGIHFNRYEIIKHENKQHFIFTSAITSLSFIQFCIKM